MIDWVSMVGYIAAMLVASTFYMKTMIGLRCFAIASNFCFIVYAYYHLPILYPVLFLHMFLLPLNCHRLKGLLKEESNKNDNYNEESHNTIARNWYGEQMNHYQSLTIKLSPYDQAPL